MFGQGKVKGVVGHTSLQQDPKILVITVAKHQNHVFRFLGFSGFFLFEASLVYGRRVATILHIQVC